MNQKLFHIKYRFIMYNECCKWKASLLLHQNQHWLQFKILQLVAITDTNNIPHTDLILEFKIQTLKCSGELVEFSPRFLTYSWNLKKYSQNVPSLLHEDALSLLLTFSWTSLPFCIILFEKNKRSTHNKYVDPTRQSRFSHLVLQWFNRVVLLYVNVHPSSTLLPFSKHWRHNWVARVQRNCMTQR